MREAIIDRTLTGVAVGAGTSLSIDGLSYHAAGRNLIDDLALSLPGSGISVIMGPNGAGKSLLLRLAHGLLVPTSGVIKWGGEAVSKKITRRQALIFQSPVLLRRSVSANIDFVLKARGFRDPERREQLLARVGLAHLAKMPARRLSGGERQRLQFARALALEPNVFLMDEPTASLDPASTAAIETLVQDVARRGAKVIFVTHDVGQARRLANDVTFLARGSVLEQAGASTFFERPQTDEARAYLHGRLVI